MLTGKNIGVSLFFGTAIVYLFFYNMLSCCGRIDNNVIIDVFHIGEYFVSGASIFNTIQHPFTIHGGLDYYPMLLALKFSDNYFYITDFIYKISGFISALLFLLLIAQVSNSDKKYLLLMLLLPLIPAMITYRELFLLASLIVFFSIINKNQNKLFFYKILVLGALLALGLLWSFDRGIIATVSIGLALTYASFYEKKYFVIIPIFVATLLVGIAVTPLTSITHFIENIWMLINTSGQWSYGWSRNTIIKLVYIFTLGLIVFATLFNSIYSKGKVLSLEEKMRLIASFFLIVLMLKVGINRLDDSHVYMSLWAIILILFSVSSIEVEFNLFTKILYTPLIIISLIGLVKYPHITILIIIYFLTIYNSDLSRFIDRKKLLIFSLVTIFFITNIYENKWVFNNYWLETLKNAPENHAMLTKEMKWVSSILEKNKVKCVFDLSNNGVINGALNLPSCSKFAYPVYANSNYEKDLISDLKNADPSVIVYSSTYWSYAIDGRSMKDRFPKLDNYILETYPSEECNLGYCVRYRNEEKINE